MAKEETLPQVSLLTKEEYDALLPQLKRDYDKVYGEGIDRKHHIKGLTQAKLATVKTYTVSAMIKKSKEA